MLLLQLLMLQLKRSAMKTHKQRKPFASASENIRLRPSVLIMSNRCKNEFVLSVCSFFGQWWCDLYLFFFAWHAYSDRKIGDKDVKMHGQPGSGRSDLFLTFQANINTASTSSFVLCSSKICCLPIVIQISRKRSSLLMHIN